MKLKRLPVLPLLLGLVVLGFWFIQSGGQGPDAGAGPGGEGVVFAGEDGALTLAGRPSDPDLEQDAGTGRQEVELEPLPLAESATPEVEPEPGFDTRLIGTVLRTAGGPIPGANVVLRKAFPWFTPPANAEPLSSMGKPSPAFLAVSDEEGKFTLFDLPAGQYSMAISAERYAPLSRHGLEIPVHVDYDIGEFKMELGIRLEGRVLGPKGKGMEGVAVLSAITRHAGHTRLELPGLGVPLGHSGPDGEFSVAGLAPGGWHLIFDAPGYRIEELQGETEPAGQAERGLLVALDTGQFIRGSVSGLDPVAEGPLRVAVRTAKDQPTAASDELTETEKLRARSAPVLADGRFEVSGLAPGVKYRLHLERQKPPADVDVVAGREQPEQWTKVSGVDHLESLPGLGEVEFKYLEEASVVFKATHKESGKALGSFRVQVSGSKLGGAGLLKGEDGETRTDFPGGDARFEGLRPPELGTSITVRVTADGYADFVKQNLMLRPGEALEIEEVRLSPAPMGEVLVLDKKTGEPIPLARVAYSKAVDAGKIARYLKAEGDLPGATDTLRFGACDEKGVARLTLWEGSICAVRAVATGYQKGEQKTLAPPYDEVLHLELVRGGQITVNVTDDQGEPVPGMYVQHSIDGSTQRNNHYWDPDSGLENKTGEDGQVVFLNLPMGKHGFQALETISRYGRGGEDAGFEAKGDIYLEEGETKVLDLRVAARGGLNLTLLEQGLPLEGALIKIQPLGESAARNSFWFGAQNQDPRTQVSDYAGRAIFKGIKVGEYLLRVSHGDRRMVVHREIRVTREPLDLQIELGLTTIEGRVTDPSGSPIQGVTMDVRPAEDSNMDRDMNDYRMRISEDENGNADYNYESIKTWSIRTDSDGRYTLRGVAPEVLLKTSALSPYVVVEERQLGPLGIQEYVGSFDFVLERAGVLDLRLDGVQRQQRDGYSFHLTRFEGEEEKESQTRAMREWRSNLEVESLRPGKWRVRLHHKDEDAALDEREITVQVGETTRITFSP